MSSNGVEDVAVNKVGTQTKKTPISPTIRSAAESIFCFAVLIVVSTAIASWYTNLRTQALSCVDSEHGWYIHPEPHEQSR